MPELLKPTDNLGREAALQAGH